MLVYLELLLFAMMNATFSFFPFECTNITLYDHILQNIEKEKRKIHAIKAIRCNHDRNQYNSYSKQGQYNENLLNFTKQNQLTIINEVNLIF